MALTRIGKIAAVLAKYGHLAWDHLDELEQVHTGLKRFIAFVGGDPKKADDDDYVQSLLAKSRCGCSDTENFTEGLNSPYKWDADQMPVKFWIDALPGMSQASWKSVLKDALLMWTDNCGLTTDIVNNARDANLIIVSANIDGPSRVLADCELPTGIQRQPGRQLRCRVDAAESWATTVGRNVLSAPLVLAHELGHGCGMNHIPVSVGEALLNPMYNDRLSGPTAVDVREMVDRYGPKRTTTPPATPTPEPAVYSFTIRSSVPITIDGYRLIPRN